MNWTGQLVSASGVAYCGMTEEAHWTVLEDNDIVIKINHPVHNGWLVKKGFTLIDPILVEKEVEYRNSLDALKFANAVRKLSKEDSRFIMLLNQGHDGDEIAIRMARMRERDTA